MEDFRFTFNEKTGRFDVDDFSHSDHHDRLSDFLNELNAKKYPSMRINKGILIAAIVLVILTAALIIFKRFLIFIAPLLLFIYFMFICCEIETLQNSEKRVQSICDKHKVLFERQTGLHGTQIINKFKPKSTLCCFPFYYLGDAKDLDILIKLNRTNNNRGDDRLMIDAPVYESIGNIDERIPIYNVNRDKVGLE